MAIHDDAALASYADNKHIYRFGDLKIDKGKMDEDTLFYAWDAVNQCEGESCPIHDECPYAKKGRCGIQANFLRSLSVMLYRNLYEEITEIKLYRFGLSLMPLYKILSKLYIKEHSVREPIYLDDKGVRRSNPIYKEIRDTLWAIDREWRRLGFSDGQPDTVEDPFSEGDPYIHEEEKSSKVRKIRRRGKK
jgi:hypothetical protein